MKSYDIDLSLSMHIVVPDSFIQGMRADSRDPELSTEFLRDADAQFPDDGDFGLHLVKHALRRVVRGSIVQELRMVGIGGRFAPAEIRHREAVLAG